MITLDTIPLPNFVRLNPLGQSAWRSQSEYALDGSLHVESAKVKAGLGISLYSEGEAYELVNQLSTHAKSTGPAPFDLTINSEVIRAMWDFANEPIQATPVKLFSDGTPDDMEAITLRLITV